ncbi:MAG: glycosyl transferase, partial [Spirochaetes bacterium]|nr:glycosyl transferase [Spirochaetota bacterium]
MNDKNLSIGIIGNYLPRQCGIATFTTDLCNAISKELNTPSKVAVVAMDDIPKGYPYPEDVCFQVRANLQTDYLWAAKY